MVNYDPHKKYKRICQFRRCGVSTLIGTTPVPLGVNLEFDPSTVATSTDYNAVSYPFQRKGFYAAGRFWAFYSNGTNAVYESTTDPNDWTGTVTSIGTCTSGYDFSVWFDGTYVHYARYRNYYLYYRRGTPNSDGTITWSADEQTVYEGTSSEYYSYPNIAVDSGGHAWIGVRRYVSLPSYTPCVFKNANNDGTWTTATDFPYQFSTTSDSTWRVQPVALTNLKVYVIYCRYNIYPSGKLYTGSWGAGESDLADYYIRDGYQFCAVAEGDNVHFAYNRYSTYQLRYNKRTYGTGWGTNDVLVVDSMESTSAPSLSINTANGDLYLFYGRVDTDHVYYIKCVGGTWDASPTDWIDESTDTIYTGCLHNVYAQAYGNYIGLLYVTKSASPYNIKFAYLTLALEVSIVLRSLFNISGGLETISKMLSSFSRIGKSIVSDFSKNLNLFSIVELVTKLFSLIFKDFSLLFRKISTLFNLKILISNLRASLHNLSQNISNFIKLPYNLRNISIKLYSFIHKLSIIVFSIFTINFFTKILTYIKRNIIFSLRELKIKTNSFKYNLSGFISRIFSSLYSFAGLITRILISRFSIMKTLSSFIRSLHTNLMILIKSSTFVYNLRNLSLKSISSIYKLRNLVLSSVSSIYKILGVIFQHLTSIYLLRQHIFNLLRSIHKLRINISSKISNIYLFKVLRTKVISSIYGLKSITIKILKSLYNIIQVGIVNMFLVLKHSLNQIIPRSIIILYKNLNLKDTFLKAVYSIRNLVNLPVRILFKIKNISLSILKINYALRERIDKVFGSLYSLVLLQLVNRILTLKYFLNNLVKNILGFVYNLRTIRLSLLVLLSKLRINISSSFKFPFIIFKNISTFLTSLFSLRKSILMFSSFIFSIRRNVSKLFLYFFNLRNLVKQKITSFYGTFSRTIRTLQIIFDIGLIYKAILIVNLIRVRTLKNLIKAKRSYSIVKTKIVSTFKKLIKRKLE